MIPQGDSLSDAELVAGLRRRDPRAFDATYDRYHARIWSYLIRLARSREVAQDLAQETWLSAARRADRLTEDTNLTAWLFTVATNHYRSYRRWSFLHVARHDPIEMEIEPAAASPGPEGTANARAQVTRLEEALGRVAPAHREVLLLTAVEGLETAEVAAVLGLREDAVRKRLSRARAELTELLGEDRGPSAPIRGKTQERASRRESAPGDSQA